MSRQSFIDELISLLVKIDRGMLESEEPLPLATEEGIKAAVAAFGKEALPPLHDAVSRNKFENDLPHLIDVLGMIGDPASIPYLVELHRKFASYVSGLAAVQALRKIGTEAAYIYLNDHLIQYLSDNKSTFTTGMEIVVTCKALAEWNDERAIPALQRAIRLRDPNGLPEKAIDALVAYPQAHAFLSEFADRHVELRETIAAALKKQAHVSQQDRPM